VPLASDWSNLLTGLAPFVLLIAFWILLTNRQKRQRGVADPQQQTLEVLGEIREEVVRLREAIESRP
jgi:uncharacterized membrane protein